MQKAVANPTEHNFHIGHATDHGGPGQHNSDAYLIFPSITGGSSHKAAPIWYALVADGLGNDRGSYVASQLAVESTYQALTQSLDPKLTLPQRLEAALQHANLELRNLANEDRTLQGMAATMMAAAIHNERLYLANAGNCYAYLIRKGEVQRITPNRLTTRLDSDIVADAPFVGLLPQREGPVMHRLLGSGDRVEIEHLQVDRDESETRRRIRIGRADDANTQSSIVDHLPIRPGDIIVLCSGGTARATTKEEILSVASTYPPEDAAERLVRLARRRISTENSTVVVLKWRGSTVPLRRMRNIQQHGTSLIAAALLLMVGVWLALSLSLNVSANWAQKSPEPQPITQPGAAVPAVSAEESGIQAEPAPAVGQPDAATAADGAGSAEPTAHLVTQLPTTELPGTGHGTTGQLQPPSSATAVLDTAALEAISPPTDADLSVSIREHWNTFLQRSTADGSRPATAVAPAENKSTATTETVPATTAIPIATATPAVPTVSAEPDAAPPTAADTGGTDGARGTGGTTYVVQPNDTLWEIATEHGLTVEALLVANPQIGSQEQTLTLGMEIYIP